jgi:deoxyribose-phosphate aldolase
MEIEYSYYDIASSDEEIKAQLTKAVLYPISSVSVLPHFLKCAKSVIAKPVKLSTPIDYPMGILDLKSRLSAVEYAVKNGADIIEVVAPSHAMCNRKYEKIRDDIKANLDFCLENNVELRYIVDYRIFSYDVLYKVAQIFISSGIGMIYPSTASSLDDIHDNIIASALINKKVPQIKIICTGNLWNANQAEIVKKADLYGIKVNSINGLDLLTKNL